MNIFLARSFATFIVMSVPLLIFPVHLSIVCEFAILRRCDAVAPKQRSSVCINQASNSKDKYHSNTYPIQNSLCVAGREINT